MEQKYFKMKNGVRFENVTIYSIKQQETVGKFIGQAISQGREFELRQGDHQSILVLLSAADNMGNVYKIDKQGGYKNIGYTEKGL